MFETKKITIDPRYLINLMLGIVAMLYATDEPEKMAVAQQCLNFCSDDKPHDGSDIEKWLSQLNSMMHMMGPTINLTAQLEAARAKLDEITHQITEVHKIIDEYHAVCTHVKILDSLIKSANEQLELEQRAALKGPFDATKECLVRRLREKMQEVTVLKAQIEADIKKMQPSFDQQTLRLKELKQNEWAYSGKIQYLLAQQIKKATALSQSSPTCTTTPECYSALPPHTMWQQPQTITPDSSTPCPNPSS